MYIVLSGLTRMLAPMLSYTADEIWQSMPHLASDDARSVMLNNMPEVSPEYSCPEIEERYNKLFDLRDDVMKALELSRAEKKIGKSLDAKITLFTSDAATTELLESFGRELNDVFIVSGVAVKNEAAPVAAFTETASGIGVLVEGADGQRCDRCWAYSTEGEATEDGFLCCRCKAVISD